MHTTTHRLTVTPILCYANTGSVKVRCHDKRCLRTAVKSAHQKKKKKKKKKKKSERKEKKERKKKSHRHLEDKGGRETYIQERKWRRICTGGGEFRRKYKAVIYMFINQKIRC